MDTVKHFPRSSRRVSATAAARRLRRPATGNLASLHEQVALAIRQGIRTGRFPAGQWLPSLREMAGELKVSLKVVHVAVQNLQAEGVIRAHHGKGSLVVGDASATTPAILFGLIHPYASSMAFYSQVLGAVEEAFARRSNLIVTQTSGEDSRKALAIAEHLVANGVQGLLLWPAAQSQATAGRWQAISEKVPVLLIDRPWETTGYPAIAHDMDRCGQQVAERFLDPKTSGPLLVLQDDLDIWPYRQWLKGLHGQAEKMNRAADIRIVRLPISKAIEQADLGRIAAIGPIERAVMKQINRHRPATLFCLQHDLIRYLIKNPATHQAIASLGVGIILNRFPLSADLKQVLPDIHGFAWRMQMDVLIRRAADAIQHWVLSRKAARRIELLDIPMFPF